MQLQPTSLEPTPCHLSHPSLPHVNLVCVRARVHECVCVRERGVDGVGSVVRDRRSRPS